MNQTQLPNWRDVISTPSEVLKVKDGESVIVTFLDEGEVRESVDYGKSIAFKVKVTDNDEEKTFYVKANNFTFLSQLKSLGELTNLKVKISRKGSKRSDTRYTIEKL